MFFFRCCCSLRIRRLYSFFNYKAQRHRDSKWNKKNHINLYIRLKSHMKLYARSQQTCIYPTSIILQLNALPCTAFERTALQPSAKTRNAFRVRVQCTKYNYLILNKYSFNDSTSPCTLTPNVTTITVCTYTYKHITSERERQWYVVFVDSFRINWIPRRIFAKDAYLSKWLLYANNDAFIH